MIVLYSILFVLLLTLAYTYYRYHTYDPEDTSIKVEKSDLQYFSENYTDARKAFLDKAKELGKKFRNTEISSIRIDSKVDPGLYLDLCHIPSSGKTGRLLVLVSGTHGIEGYAGGAVQQMFMNEILSEDLIKDTGILLIHSLNPFGQKYFRKTTEFNVDLNRNCVADSSHFNKTNKGYSRLRRLLVPLRKVNKNNIYHRFFYIVAIWKIIKELIQL